MGWKFSELVDVGRLQLLMDRFYAATAIPVGIIATNGEILVATGWQDLCTKFHRIHPVTAQRCRESDDYIKTRLASKGPVQYKCRNGLWDLAVPIIISAEHVATLFLGQFFYDDEVIDENYFRSQALEFGFDLAGYLEALRRVPVYSREKVKDIMGFYTSFVEFLVSIGVSNRQRSEAENALRESEEKFAKAFHTAPIPMVISTIEDGTYLEVNEEFERQHGYRRSEVIGRTAVELDLWCDSHVRQEIVDCLKAGGAVRDREVTLRDREGGLRFGLYSGSVIEVQGKKLMLALRTDLTERKRMEEEIEVLNSELAARASLLEIANQELESFNYTVSHDLRRYLSVIGGYGHLGMERSESLADQELTGYLAEICGSASHMEQLVESLLRFSLLSRAEVMRQPVNLTELAKRVSLSLRMSEPARKATFIIGEGIRAPGDPRLLEVVMENLLGNAWKFTGGGDPAVIEFGAAGSGDGRAYFVRDNGTGFDMAQAERLFRPFERLTETAHLPGHGIGLATVQRIVQRHGGTVWAESEPGKGATFWFTLGGLPGESNTGLRI
ncbi:hypothetical protein GMSM_40380 [Geomonas sp. Red276]